jgi:hypothetical protein
LVITRRGSGPGIHQVSWAAVKNGPELVDAGVDDKRLMILEGELALLLRTRDPSNSRLALGTLCGSTRRRERAAAARPKSRSQGSRERSQRELGAPADRVGHEAWSRMVSADGERGKTDSNRDESATNRNHEPVGKLARARIGVADRAVQTQSLRPTCFQLGRGL